MRGAVGQYVSKHYVVNTETGDPVRKAQMQRLSGLSYFRLRHRKGLPYARAYARGFNRVAEKDRLPLATVIEFAEVPPGALGGARGVAIVTAALVVFFALLRPTETNVSTDIAALLLATPAVIATWVGHSIERLRLSSLATYFGLLSSQVLSVVSALLYVAERRWENHSRELFTVTSPQVLGGVTLPTVDGMWLALAAGALVVAVYLSIVLSQRTRRYLHMVECWNKLDGE
jgi:hypothetical protein